MPDFPLPSNLATTKVVAAADPAAGVEISITVPAGKWWFLRALRFTLVTAVAVANRRPAVTIDDGATEWWRWRAGIDQPASTTRLYQFLHEANTEIDRSATFNELYEPINEDLLLVPGSRIRTVTSGIQAADDYSAAVLYVVELG